MLGAAAALGALALAAAAPRTADPPTRARASWAVWLALVGLVAAAAGLAIGAARLTAIDAGALRAAPGSRVRVSGFVAAVPRRVDGTVDIRV